MRPLFVPARTFFVVLITQFEFFIKTSHKFVAISADFSRLLDERKILLPINRATCQDIMSLYIMIDTSWNNDLDISTKFLHCQELMQLTESPGVFYQCEKTNLYVSSVCARRTNH